MFTGLIERLGSVEALDPVPGGARLTVEPASAPAHLAFFLSDETLEKTSLGSLRPGGLVNLERALAAGDRLGGHLVMGHVDTVGTLRRLDRHGDGWDLEVAFPESFRPFVAPKGSVTIDGISLTPVDVTPTTLTVAVIPHTYDRTNLRSRKAGDPLNLEADIIARYVVHFLANTSAKGGVTEALLKQAGF
jgi:riboflavin synthase